MSALQKTAVVIVALAALAFALYQGQQISSLRDQVQMLGQQKEQQTILSNKVHELEKERDTALSRLASLSKPTESPTKGTNEVLKLRGEVGRLRRENADIASSSGLSKVTANPESKKMLRDQQKLGMAMIYSQFAKKANLSKEQTDQLNDVLADHIIENVENVTKVLRDKPPPDQMNQMFSDQDSALQEKLQALLGQDGLSQYQDYTKNLASALTAQQFKGMMTGTDEAKEEKSKKLFQLMQEEVQTMLSNAGLPPDYQMVPMLNFRNIASEQEGEKSLKLLDDVYKQVSGRVNAFLAPEEIEKFQEFKDLALKNNRNALTLNRTLMAPISNP
jgi:hypothetical protein